MKATQVPVKEEKSKERSGPKKWGKSARFSESHDESNWLISYADLMTLLCGFFILLLSMAKIDESEFNKMKDELAKHFDETYVAPKNELAESLIEQVNKLGLEKYAKIITEPKGVIIIFESGILFDSGSASVNFNGKSIIKEIIRRITSIQENKAKLFRIAVEGHTDARPINAGNFPSNWELSGARASSVVRMFIAENFPSKQLTALGYAESYPQVEVSPVNGKWDEQLLAKNRRVVIRILEPHVEGIPFPEELKRNTQATSLPTNQENSTH